MYAEMEIIHKLFGGRCIHFARTLIVVNLPQLSRRFTAPTYTLVCTNDVIASTDYDAIMEESSQDEASKI